MIDRQLSNLKPLVVDTATYSSRYYRISSDLLFMQRSHFWQSPASEIDAFPDLWTLTFCDFEPGQVALRARGKVLPLIGKNIVFIPKFNLVEWILGTGHLNWSCILSKNDPPTTAPRTACVFPWPKNLDILNPTDVLNWLQNANALLPIDKMDKSSVVAERTKQEIDQNFKQSFKIGDVAKKLGYHHSVMDREFKSCFGISPLTYRNRLRVFEAQSLLLFQSLDVSQTAQTVGFCDSSQLSHHYRSLIKASPSLFRPLKTD